MHLTIFFVIILFSPQYVTAMYKLLIVTDGPFYCLNLEHHNLFVFLFIIIYNVYLFVSLRYYWFLFQKLFLYFLWELL